MRTWVWTVIITLLMASSAAAQPGVVNNQLVDPAAYVGSLITYGQFIPRELVVGELARIKPMLNACNLHLQNEDRGDYRARVFLPPSQYDHPVDIYDWSGSQTWVWIDRGGPWNPPTCNFGQPVPVPAPNPAPQPTPQPIPTDGKDLSDVVAAIDRNTAELKSIHEDAKGAFTSILKWSAEHIIPPVLAAIATWKVAQ